MKKYIVFHERRKDGEYLDSDMLGICDTMEEAERRALKEMEFLPANDGHFVSIGEITEDDLTEKGEWVSFSHVDTLWEIGDPRTKEV